MRAIYTFVMLGLGVIIGISQVTIGNYKKQVEQLQSELFGMTSVAVSCGAEMEEAIEWRNTCNAIVYTLDHTNEEYQGLIDKAAEGLDTCVANVEFFKDLAAYNEDNLMTCLYDLRIERGQRTDGN